MEPSPATTASEATPVAAPPPTPSPPVVTPSNPAVTQLKALFPDIEDDVLEAVLDAHAGSFVEATESLLALSDPTFQPEPQVC